MDDVDEGEVHCMLIVERYKVCETEIGCFFFFFQAEDGIRDRDG